LEDIKQVLPLRHDTPVSLTTEEQLSISKYYHIIITTTSSYFLLLGPLSAQPKETKYLVKIRQRTSKGLPDWNHIVTLEGSITEASSTDFVYWLEQHLETSFGLSLTEFPWHLTTEEKLMKLWPWKKETMSRKFAKRAIQAGFPKGLLSYHSLRYIYHCVYKYICE
jgi:hypothetical protein